MIAAGFRVKVFLGLLVSGAALTFFLAWTWWIRPWEERFKLTDKRFASLRAEGVPEAVLSKLKALKDKAFDREPQFRRELVKNLDKDELERFQDQILNHAENTPSFDQAWARRMKDFAQGHGFLRGVMVWLTFLGEVYILAVFAAVGVLGSWWCRQRWLAGVWLAAVAGGALLNLALKTSIDRVRPDIPDAAVHEHNESYPSGHAMGSTIGFGLVACAAVLGLRRRREKVLLVVSMVTLIGLIGLSRIFLRAHWFSDVIAGFAIGASWLALWLTVLAYGQAKFAQKKPA